MEFGLFVEFPSREGTTQAQIFKDSMELIDAEVATRNAHAALADLVADIQAKNRNAPTS